MTKQRVKIYVCTNTRGGAALSCGGQGAHALVKAIRDRAEAQGLAIDVEETVCLGRCQNGPNVRIHGGAFFEHFSEADLDALFAAVSSGG